VRQQFIDELNLRLQRMQLERLESEAEAPAPTNGKAQPNR